MIDTRGGFLLDAENVDTSTRKKFIESQIKNTMFDEPGTCDTLI